MSLFSKDVTVPSANYNYYIKRVPYRFLLFSTRASQPQVGDKIRFEIGPNDHGDKEDFCLDGVGTVKNNVLVVRWFISY